MSTPRTGILKLCIVRGLAFGVTLQLLEDDGTTPVDLTGKTPRAQARKLPTSAVLIDFAPIVTDAANGMIRIAKNTAAVMTFEVFSGEWDLVLEDDGTQERGPRLLTGTCTVTNAETRP